MQCIHYDDVCILTDLWQSRHKVLRQAGQFNTASELGKEGFDSLSCLDDDVDVDCTPSDDPLFFFSFTSLLER